MALASIQEYHERLNQIAKSADPRNELCSWLNRMNAEETVFFLRYVAGWTTAEYFVNRGFRSQDDKLFDEVYSELIKGNK